MSQHFRIRDTGRFSANPDDIVTKFEQSRHRVARKILVSQKAHNLISSNRERINTLSLEPLTGIR